MNNKKITYFLVEAGKKIEYSSEFAKDMFYGFWFKRKI